MQLIYDDKMAVDILRACQYNKAACEHKTLRDK